MAMTEHGGFALEELQLATVVRVDDFEENGPRRTLLVSMDTHE